jgi:alginate O-acetyltransferase complex protein AlgI
MLFNSFEFLIFFVAVTSLYFLLPHKYRWALLLLASCIFYMFFVPAYILILFFTITVDYFAGILIENAGGIKRKRYLWLSLAANISVLAVFKYYNFLNDNITELLGFVGTDNPIPYLDIILPIGLSFHTFQAMSYTIEVYRGHQKAERKFGIFALYVMFYPQLVAGPIERPQNLLHQFHEKHNLDFQQIADGLKLIIWGLFKKVVIADRLAPMVDAVYNNPGDHYGVSVIIATIFFAFQIYCDFSGYSDIAIGAARVMGFNLMTNFRTPYFAETIADFWKRWHISLSTWFKDYLYIPLGGNRVKKSRLYFNLFLTFMISGIWHGANWTYIAWGALHGSYLVIAIMTQHSRSKLLSKLGVFKNESFNKVLNSILVFILVTFAWVFFRADSINDAFLLIEHACSFTNSGFQAFIIANSYMTFGLGSFFILALLIVEKLMADMPADKFINTFSGKTRIAIYISLTILILNFGVFGGNNFIYFQF